MATYMKTEYINPFIKGAFSVMEAVLGAKPAKGEPFMQPTTFSSQQCNIALGITGQVQGNVTFGMSLETADKIAAAMVGQENLEFDALAASALGELGNMICGNAAQQLHEAGWICDITPPTIMRGANIQMAMLTIPAVVVPLTVAQGEIFVSIALQGRK